MTAPAGAAGRRPARPGRYRAVVFDLDGTLTREANSWAALQRGLGPELHDRARDRWRRYAGGGMSREDFLVDQVADLTDHDAQLVDRVVAGLEYQDGVADACAALRAGGLRLAIVSAGIGDLAARVAADLGIELHRANAIHRSGGRLTGTADIGVPPGGKEPAFREVVARLGVALDEVVAVGDSSGDIDMFRLAGLGVAFCPSGHAARDAADIVLERADMRDLLPLVLPS